MTTLLNPDSTTALVAIRWLVFCACVLTWAAFVLLWQCKRCDTGGRALVLFWLAHAGLWLGINSYLRIFQAYTTPTILLSMWGTVLYIQAAVSVMLYVLLWRKGIRHD